MTTDHLFRFGVLAGPLSDVDAWRQRARQAEELGYSSLLVPDHMGREWGPLVSLAVAAGCTTRLQLGTLMLAVDLRLPSVLFKELATLDLLAPGRLEIGLGAGWFGQDFERAGVPMAPHATRIERLDEAAALLRQLWDTGTASRQGGHYPVAGAVGTPRPQPARWTMGGGGRRMLRTAVRHADIVSLNARLDSAAKGSQFGQSATAAAFDRRTAWVKEFAADRGTDPQVQCLAHAAAVVPDAKRYGDRVLARMFGLPVEDALDSPLSLVGTVEEIVTRVLDRRERFGISYYVVPAAQVADFAPVVERLSGA